MFCCFWEKSSLHLWCRVKNLGFFFVLTLRTSPRLFCGCCKATIWFYSPSHRGVKPAPFTKKSIFSSLLSDGSSAIHQALINTQVCFWACSAGLFLCCHADRTLQLELNGCLGSPPAVPCLNGVLALLVEIWGFNYIGWIQSQHGRSHLLLSRHHIQDLTPVWLCIH